MLRVHGYLVLLQAKRLAATDEGRHIAETFWAKFGIHHRAASSAAAQSSATVQGNLFYTDDVALFSATRRLNLHGDPTQPVLHTSLTEKGSDMVFEPDLLATKSFTSQWGRTELSFRGQAFVYAVNPRFNHGSFGVQMLQESTPNTRVRLRYYTTPIVQWRVRTA